MPTLHLSAVQLGPQLLVTPPVGGRQPVPRAQLRCLLRPPGYLMPQDGVIDTGAPLTCFPRSVWDRFTEGTGFEWWPFDAAVLAPTGQMAGWRYTFRMARLLAPLTVLDVTTEVDRPDVVAQFTDNDPPNRRGNAVPLVVIGLWGGLLEGGTLAIARDSSGRITGTIAFP